MRVGNTILPNSEKMDKALHSLSALTHLRRIRIVKCLLQNENATFSDLSRDCKIKERELEKHLTVLHNAAILQWERESIPSFQLDCERVRRLTEIAHKLA